MTEEKEKQEYYPEEHSGAPRWMTFAVVVLAAISLAAVGFGYQAVSQARGLEKGRASLEEEVAGLHRSLDTIDNRLAQTEDINAKVQGELNVVTDRLKLTQGELARARKQARDIKEQYDKQIAEMEDAIESELSTKASAEDLKNLSGDVGNVRNDLDATKQNFQMARGELGTLIARNHEEIEVLRRMGQRDYHEFNLTRKGQREKLGNVTVELRGTNQKRNQFTVALYVDDMRLEKKNRSVNEPIYFYTAGSRAPLELVVNKVEKNRITGYVSVPKTLAASSGTGR
jgi:chromosome segregation ATPase